MKRLRDFPGQVCFHSEQAEQDVPKRRRSQSVCAVKILYDISEDIHKVCARLKSYVIFPQIFPKCVHGRSQCDLFGDVPKVCATVRLLDHLAQVICIMIFMLTLRLRNARPSSIVKPCRNLVIPRSAFHCSTLH